MAFLIFIIVTPLDFTCIDIPPVVILNGAPKTFSYPTAFPSKINLAFVIFILPPLAAYKAYPLPLYSTVPPVISTFAFDPTDATAVEPLATFI